MYRPSIEPRKACRPGCRRRSLGRKATSGPSVWQEGHGPRVVRGLEHVQNHLTREPGDPGSTLGRWCHGSCWEVYGQKPAMNRLGKSDGRVLPTKSPNNEREWRKRGYGRPYAGTKAETPETDKGRPTVEATDAHQPAEGMEERRPTKGNLMAKPPCQLVHGRPPLGAQPCQIWISAERRATARYYLEPNLSLFVASLRPDWSPCVGTGGRLRRNPHKLGLLEEQRSLLDQKTAQRDDAERPAPKRLGEFFELAKSALLKLRDGAAGGKAPSRRGSRFELHRTSEKR